MSALLCPSTAKPMNGSAREGAGSSFGLEGKTDMAGPGSGILLLSPCNLLVLGKLISFLSPECTVSATKR